MGQPSGVPTSAFPDFEPIAVEFRDLQPTDLADLAWSGGEAHLAALETAMQASWEGEAAVLVGELRNGALVASGGVNLALDPPRLWMLAVHHAWQSLGVGTALIRALAERARLAGADSITLTVEDDNPRAKSLYRRLGFVTTDTALDSWPTDDGITQVAACEVMTRQLPS